MENVVRLAEYRMRRQATRKAPSVTGTRPSGSSQYFCTRCDADEFRLFASGKAHCAQCGAMMRNLLVRSD